MLVSGNRISPTNPFDTVQPLLGKLPRLQSPQVGRLRAMWAKMRSVVTDRFPATNLQVDTEIYLASLEDIYPHDAYNSLSIEGYRVTPEIIAPVHRGDWDPEREADREHVAAMAAYNNMNTTRLIGSGG